jgi:hypothetical protein
MDRLTARVGPMSLSVVPEGDGWSRAVDRVLDPCLVSGLGLGHGADDGGRWQVTLRLRDAASGEAALDAALLALGRWMVRPGARTGSPPTSVWAELAGWRPRLGLGPSRDVALDLGICPALLEAWPVPEGSARYWVARMALRMVLGVAAGAAGALLLHGAAVVAPDGGAVVAVGASGAGKTTLPGRLPGWTALGDDAVVVWPEGGLWWVSGTPLRGREGGATRLEPHRLRGLVSLSPKAPELALRRLDVGAVLGVLMQRTCLDADPTIPSAVAERVLSTAGALAESVPGFVLASSLGHDVAPALAQVARGEGGGDV